MSGYLLDTNTVYVLSNLTHAQHSTVKAKANALPPESPLYVSAITRGEIIFGHALNKTGDEDFRQKLRNHIEHDYFPLDVSRYAAEIYGEIRANLCERLAPPGGWTRKKRAEQLCDPVSGLALGIDENDLWLVAQALERNVVLVTTDKLTSIKQAIRQMPDDSLAAYRSFRTENWLEAAHANNAPTPTP